MSLVKKAKESLKRMIEAERKKARERKAYNKILREKIKAAQRQSYSKEAIKQARIRARLEAKRKFAKPKKQTSSLGAGNILKGLPA